MKKYSLLILAFSVLIVVNTAIAKAYETTITNISVEEKAGISEIRIECDSPFTYVIYKPSDPYKIVVELLYVTPGKYTDILDFKLVDIAPAKIEDPRLARLDITLAAPFEVQHSLKGNSLILIVSDPEVKKEEENPAIANASQVKKEEGKPAATVMVSTNFGGYVSKKVASMKELRFKNIVPQRYDFSCGAAALATITKYLYDDSDVSEEEIVEWLLKNGDLEKIQQRGFSLLDLKAYAEDIGYKADGYRVKPELLPKLNIPTIVLMNTKGYSHFVVLKGVKGDKAYIADPALGNRTISADEFLTAWNGIVFVVYGKEMSSTYGGFDGPLSVNKADIWRLNDLMMRNLFMNTMEFRR